MNLDVHEERNRLRQTGKVNPIYAASELHPDIAKQRLREAVVQCEFHKVRADIRAKMILKGEHEI